MDDPLPSDVTARLARDFGERADAVAGLLLAGRRIGSADCLSDRLVRCIVSAACGDEGRVRSLLDLARQDYRDVIVAGEYDGHQRQVRDLRASFLLDGPAESWAWASEVTRLLATRGYRLTALETHTATAGPFKYDSDWGEGRATFIGPKDEIVIEKTARQWVIHGNRHELEIYGLDCAFSEESAFRDAVSGYLLSDIRVRKPEPDQVPTAAGVRRPWWRFWERGS